MYVPTYLLINFIKQRIWQLTRISNNAFSAGNNKLFLPFG